MSIGSVIAAERKKLGLTQDGLAQKLGVTNQAVSKWESEQSCPDILLLPRIADIFGITLDTLFGREAPEAEHAKAAEPVYIHAEPELPWADDGVLRVVLYAGHTYVGSCPEQEKITFEYEGPALNIECAVNIACGDVDGDVRARGNVNCDAVNGNIQCDGNVACDDIEGSVYAGGNVICDEIGGSATAGGRVGCDGGNGSFHFSGGFGGGREKTQRDDCDENSCDGDCMTCENSGFLFSIDGKNGRKEKDGKKKKGFIFRF